MHIVSRFTEGMRGVKISLSVPGWRRVIISYYKEREKKRFYGPHG